LPRAPRKDARARERNDQIEGRRRSLSGDADVTLSIRRKID